MLKVNASTNRAYSLLITYVVVLVTFAQKKKIYIRSKVGDLNKD